MSRASALVAIALPCLVSASAQEPRATPDPLDGVDAVESGSWVSVAHGDEFSVRLPLAACRTEAGGFVAATLFGVDRLGAAVRLLERIVDTVELGPGDGRPR